MDAVISIEIPEGAVPSPTISILLVEDDPSTLRAYAKLLSMDGHTVYTADGYQAALNVAKTERVEFAVCDINLWDGNGCDLLKELQKLRPMQAIAVTGFAAPDELQDYRDAGFAVALSKPVEVSALKSAVSQLSLILGCTIRPC
jgi:DNA-binding NtrC family response regulator